MIQRTNIHDTLNEFADGHATTGDQLLPLLHFVQAAHGCVPEKVIADIAQLLNISRAEVFGVVSFYDDFVLEPTGPAVEICGGEACQALGCRQLLVEVREDLSPKVHVREVFCLGNCATGPSVRIGARVLGRAALPAIVAALDSLENQS